MHAATQAWLAGLRAHAAGHRAERRSIVEPVAAERAAERLVIAARATVWLADAEAILAARRAWLHERSGEGDPDPAIVITTSVAGRAAIEEELAAGGAAAESLAEHAAVVTELEYRLWCVRHPDEGRLRHIAVWSWIKKRVPQRRHAEFARHPLCRGESYWLHRAGIAGAGAADRRECHLWKWNGLHATLAESFVAERAVKGLGWEAGDDPRV